MIAIEWSQLCRMDLLTTLAKSGNLRNSGATTFRPAFSQGILLTLLDNVLVNGDYISSRCHVVNANETDATVDE